MAQKNTHYLRAFRKRHSLSQADVAALLGNECASKVSDYERFVRAPNIANALAYEIIFNAPLSELFGDLHREIRAEISRRARKLRKRLANDGRLDPKKRLLLDLLEEDRRQTLYQRASKRL